MIQSKGCVDVTTAKNIVGDKLFEKIHSIGLFDFNVVCNNAEEVGFLTLPAAFSKYSNSMLEDAFDLAKAFVASLTYGITKSYYERGQISDIGALLRTLINGQAIGPVNAIGQDYKVLEIKGVVKIYQGSKKRKNRSHDEVIEKRSRRTCSFSTKKWRCQSRVSNVTSRSYCNEIYWTRDK